MTADRPLLWERWDDVDQLLSDALERSPPDRVAFVTRAAAEDEVLRDLVLRLLGRLEADSGRVTAPSGPVMRGAFGDPEAEPVADALSPGTAIDRYRVVAQRGRGGMATVYEAERSDGTYQQRVALKVLRRGLDTDDLIRRFLVERQILSSLTHPNIARLLDGGSTPDGRPYLVMELVEGESITAYADRQRLDAAARLRLFLGVADAVHTAHRQLVVHRDIKPSNILVDSEGRVKLLDFGIAKLLEDDAEETAVGTRPLTPVYASPEQLHGGRITTATDVYQLGLLLRELLTGMRPVAGADTGAAAAPSSRRLHGDLDIIVGKALRAEPEERYASADELAADIRRHLRGLPIMAHPESTAYRLGKFVGRHPAFLPGIALLSVGTALYIGTLARHNRRLKQERGAATAASRLATETQSFLVQLFASANPLEPADPERGRNITVVEALQLGALRVDKELDDQPELRAELLSTIGSVLEKLDQVDSARSAVGRAINIRISVGDTLSPAFADDLGELAYLLGGQQEQDSARQLLLRRLDVERRRDSVIPEREGRALMALGMLTGKVDPVAAIILTEQGVAALRRGGGKRMGEALRQLADDYRAVSRTEESESAAREALAILEREEGPSSVHTAMAAHTLGQALGARGDTVEAAAMIRRAIGVFDAQLGPSHNYTMTVRNNLGVLLTRPGSYAEAETLLREVLAARLARFGEDNSQVAGSYQNIAVTVAAQGRYREADSLARHAEAIFRRVVPNGSYIIAFPMLTRAEILLQGGDAAGAARVATGAADILRGKVPTGHAAAIMADCRLGRARAQLGDLKGAKVLLDSAVQRMSRAKGLRASQLAECRDAITKLEEASDPKH